MKSNLTQLLILFLLCILPGCAVTGGNLISAAYDGDTTAVKTLLGQGANVNERGGCGLWEIGGDFGATPLLCAALHGNLDTVKELIAHGADVNAKANGAYSFGKTPLTAAAHARHTGITKLLIEKGADLDYAMSKIKQYDPDGYSFLQKFNHSLATVQTPLIAQQHQTVAAHPTSDIDTAIPTGKPANKYDVAVVIGNSNYSSTGTPNVDFAIHDAQAMKEYLIKAFGYDPANIIYLENATLTRLNEVFGTDSDYRGKLYKWVKPDQSRIFIYYVGHGAPDQQTGEGYFVPVDANPQYISTSGYKLSTFYENLSRISAIKKTVVIDACFSGSSANGQLIKGVSGLTARLKSEPKASVAADLLLTSAGMDQVASWYPEKGHSLFTYFFLKGIQGEADVNKDGKTTMGEMKIYLNEHVPYMARRLTGNEQQPVILGKDGDDLVVIIQ
jgi:hypothetical protein